MHRSNGALLARAYIMQKQVLAFSVCFFSIFIQITLVHGLRREPFSVISLRMVNDFQIIS